MISIPLPGGRGMPALGLGTWQLRGGACERAVRTALELGYRHIDTAEMYGNEAEVGAAIRAAGVDRADLFITTKVWPDHFRAPALRRAAEDSLRRLGTDHVDLLLLHWPNPAIPLAEPIGALDALHDEGKALAIGVSNFDAALLKEAQALARAPIACDQVRMHVQSPQRELLAHARSQGIAVTAYSPLGQGGLRDHPTLARIGARHGRTAAQVALRWILQHEGVAAIPKASGEKHLRENLDVFSWSLDDAEMAEIASA